MESSVRRVRLMPAVALTVVVALGSSSVRVVEIESDRLEC